MRPGSSTASIESSGTRSTGTVGSQARTFMPRASAFSASSGATWPSPTMPRVRPRTSTPDRAASGRLRDVDVGGAQSRATHHLEVAAGPQDLCGHSMRRADDQTVATRDPPKKLVLVPAGAGVDLKAVAAEKLDALGGEFLENDDSLLLAHSTAPHRKVTVPSGSGEQGVAASTPTSCRSAARR